MKSKIGVITGSTKWTVDFRQGVVLRVTVYRASVTLNVTCAGYGNTRHLKPFMLKFLVEKSHKLQISVIMDIILQ